MKIISTDNFQRDYKSDSLVCENVSEYYGEMIVKFLNKKNEDDEHNPNFYRLVENDYKLYKFEP